MPCSTCATPPRTTSSAQLYPADARCLVHESMAPGLAAAGRRARAQGEKLVFWDCYRPHEVQVRMFEAVPNPAGGQARPVFCSHEARPVGGRDDRRRRRPPGQRGTDFDDFSARATAYATDGVSARPQANRARLRTAMAPAGWPSTRGEWWHFDGPGAGVQRPIIDVPVD